MGLFLTIDTSLNYRFAHHPLRLLRNPHRVMQPNDLLMIARRSKKKNEVHLVGRTLFELHFPIVYVWEIFFKATQCPKLAYNWIQKFTAM